MTNQTTIECYGSRGLSGTGGIKINSGSNHVSTTIPTLLRHHHHHHNQYYTPIYYPPHPPPYYSTYYSPYTPPPYYSYPPPYYSPYYDAIQNYYKPCVSCYTFPYPYCQYRQCE